MKIFKLKEFRKFRNMKQADLAKLLGVSTHTIVTLEKNPEKITLKQMEQIEEILKVKHEEIYIENN